MSLTPITRMTTSISNKARKHKSKMKRQAREIGYYFIDRLKAARGRLSHPHILTYIKNKRAGVKVGFS